MGQTSINSNLISPVIAPDTITEAVDDLYFMKNGLMVDYRDKKGGMILFKNDFLATGKRPEKGWQITMPYRLAPVSEGRDGDAEIKGHENAGTYYYFTFYIDQKRYSEKLEGRMDEQKTRVKMRVDAKNSISTWQKEIVEKEIFRKMGGETSYTFSNTPTAASTNRIIYGGSASSTSNITVSSTFSTNEIERGLTKAKGRTAGSIPKIGPLKSDKGYDYICFISTYQAFDLWTKDNRFYDANKSAGVRGDGNRIFTGEYDFIGIWHRVAVIVSDYIPIASTWGSGGALPGATALFCGRNAVSFALAKSPTWNEETDDRGNQAVFTIGAQWGVQKMKPVGLDDLGVLAIKTYAVDPNA